MISKSCLASWLIFFFSSPFISASSSSSTRSSALRNSTRYPASTRLVANPDGQVGLADSRWANKDQIITLVDKLKIEQGIDLALADRGLMTVVKAFQMLLRRKTGCLAVALYTAAVSPAQLILSKPASKAQVGHFTLLGFG